MIRHLDTLAVLLGLATAPALAQDPHAGHAHATTAQPTATDPTGPLHEPWSEEIVEAFEALPVQDGGRVKPMRTFADFSLLRINGKRGFVPPWAPETKPWERPEKLSASEWMLDVLVYPEHAATYETFLVADDQVIEALGLIKPEGKKKRDRYSYQFLVPGLSKLQELALQYAELDAKRRSPVQEQVVQLYGNVNLFLALAGKLDFARATLRIGDGRDLSSLFEGRDEVWLHELVEKLPAMQALHTTLAADPVREEEFREVDLLLRAAGQLAGSSGALALLPPPVSADEDTEWYTPRDVMALASSATPAADAHLEAIGHLTTLVDRRDDRHQVLSSLTSILGVTRPLAEARGEYDKVPLELSYYRAKYLTKSLSLFLLAFLLGAFLWLRPGSRLLHLGTSLATLGGAAFLVTAIVVRCMIRERPPVSTLYETLLFVTAVGTVVALFIEGVGRKRIAITMAATLGTVGLFLANGYELLDKKDTMPSLVAVLDTNFWLATHVTTITIGYAAGVLAALIGSVYLLFKTLGLKRSDPGFFKATSRMVYGVTAFGLIFSVVGTILGGIWANDSWGRFWGWDPKENGALLICLAMITTLHLRMGGYITDRGLAMCAAFTGTVVAFSWFHVNLLGVGLHSYGFTGGIHTAVWTYYGIQWSVCALGLYDAWRERMLARATALARTGQKVKLEPESEGGGALA